MPRTDSTDRICRDCWNRAIYAYGTGQIFLRRSFRLTRQLQALTYLGLLLPLLVGALVLAFGFELSHKEQIIAVAGFVGVIQLVATLWSIVYSWPDNLQYALESGSENLDLSLKFKELGGQALDPPADLEIQYAQLKSKDDSRQMSDTKRGVTAEELRYGHRAGLRQFSRACVECGQVPHSMEPTNCNTCGRF